MRKLWEFLAWMIAFNAAVAVSPFSMVPLLLPVTASQWLLGIFLLNLSAYFIFSASLAERDENASPVPKRTAA